MCVTGALATGEVVRAMVPAGVFNKSSKLFVSASDMIPTAKATSFSLVDVVWETS